MQDHNTTRRAQISANQFSLDPLPIYQDIPRPLKSLEAVSTNPMAPSVLTPNNVYTKEEFTKGIMQDLMTYGIDDSTGGILTSLLDACAENGTYKAPTKEIMDGIKIGWFSKPMAPSVSEAFERAQTDFQTEILRIMRESEDRMIRLIAQTSLGMKAPPVDQTLVPGKDQYRNITDTEYQVMIWVICYVFDMAPIATILESPVWEGAIQVMIGKKWNGWGHKLLKDTNGDRAAVNAKAITARPAFLKLRFFKDGSLPVPTVYRTQYKSMDAFLGAMKKKERALERLYGKEKK